MEEKNLLFVYNPVSGKGLVLDALAEVINIFTENGFRVTVHPTQKALDGHDYIAAHAASYDTLCIGGGDGMLNETVSALLTLPPEDRPPILYLPAGSTNDFAGSLGLPTDLIYAAKAGIGGEKTTLDAGDFNGKTFVYVAAFGAFTDVSYATPQDFKNTFGHFAYVIQGILSLPTIREHHVKITHGSTVIEGDFLYGMAANTLQVGGVRFDRSMDISLSDGFLEVMLVKRPKTPAEVQMLVGALVSQSFKCDDIITFSADSVTFESAEPIPWTLDGEYGGDTNIAHVTNRPRCYTLMRPRPLPEIEE